MQKILFLKKFILRIFAWISREEEMEKRYFVSFKICPVKCIQCYLMLLFYLFQKKIVFSRIISSSDAQMLYVRRFLFSSIKTNLIYRPCVSSEFQLECTIWNEMFKCFSNMVFIDYFLSKKIKIFIFLWLGKCQQPSLIFFFFFW